MKKQKVKQGLKFQNILQSILGDQALNIWSLLHLFSSFHIQT